MTEEIAEKILCNAYAIYFTFDTMVSIFFFFYITQLFNHFDSCDYKYIWKLNYSDGKSTP